MEPRTILAVDDSKLIHKMLEMMLLRQFSLVHAFDGAEALRLLREHGDIDLVLLGMQLPRMSELELLAEIRRDPSLAAVPIIGIADPDRPEDTERARAAGASACITKPFRSEELYSLLYELLDEQ